MNKSVQLLDLLMWFYVLCAPWFFFTSMCPLTNDLPLYDLNLINIVEIICKQKMTDNKNIHRHRNKRVAFNGDRIIFKAYIKCVISGVYLYLWRSCSLRFSLVSQFIAKFKLKIKCIVNQVYRKLKIIIRWFTIWRAER